jgi:hypothetical protein
MTGKFLLSVVLVVVLASGGCADDKKHPVNLCGDDWHPVEYPPRHPDQVTILQGVSGDVWFWEGSFQPFCETGTVRGVARRLCVYELATGQDVDWLYQTGGAFTRETRRPLAPTAMSDSSGFYQCDLPVGRYTLLAEEDSLLYPNLYSDQGISPIEVLEGQVLDLRFDIDYRMTI